MVRVWTCRTRDIGTFYSLLLRVFVGLALGIRRAATLLHTPEYVIAWRNIKLSLLGASVPGTPEYHLISAYIV